MGANASTVYETSPTKTDQSTQKKGYETYPTKTDQSTQKKGYETSPMKTDQSTQKKGYETSPAKTDQSTQKKGYETPPTKTDQSTQKKGEVIAFRSSSRWKVYFEASIQTSKLIVIDFTASWCGPCQFIQPAIDEFAEIYKDVDFIKIDVDELDGVAQKFGVRTMPTFILMKGGKEVDKVVGAKKDDLKKMIEKHRC